MSSSVSFSLHSYQELINIFSRQPIAQGVTVCRLLHSTLLYSVILCHLYVWGVTWKCTVTVSVLCSGTSSVIDRLTDRCCRHKEYQPIWSSVYERETSAGQPSHSDSADGNRWRSAVRNQSPASGVTWMCQQNTQQVGQCNARHGQGVGHGPYVKLHRPNMASILQSEFYAALHRCIVCPFMFL